MIQRLGMIHVVLVALIVGFFAFRYFGDVEMPSWLFFGLAIVVLGGAVATTVFEYRKSRQGEAVPNNPTESVEDPRFTHFLFNDVRSAPMWLVVRVYLGLQWLDSGWGKVTNEAWMDTGVAVQGFWTGAVAVPEDGRPAISYDWYRDFLNFMLEREWFTWIAPIIAVSEVLIGLGLILGVFTGLAAAGGLMLNTSFMLAGTASTNPVLGALAILIILAWKVAGVWGFDRYLLPALGAPWSPGWLARRDGATTNTRQKATT